MFRFAHFARTNAIQRAEEPHMKSSENPPDMSHAPFAYLCVDSFLNSLVAVRAIKTAFELRLLDRLQEQSFTTNQLAEHLAIERRGLALLLELLRANRVVDLKPVLPAAAGPLVELTQDFRRALNFRDLLEAKIDFANHVAPDVLDHFTELIANPALFMRRARLFDLFDYGRCIDPTPENLASTRQWMRLTTCLTRYEAKACFAQHDFGRYRRMLDIGGNSGEFALQACKKHAHLEATIFDLPVVCAIGREHVRAEPEAGRIRFQEGDALTDPLPSGFDVITFKSVLHDWPDANAKHLITRASNALGPGGTMLIFERGPLDVSASTLHFGMIPMLLLFRSFRAPTLYQEQLAIAGLREIQTQVIELEMPFFLVTGKL